MEADKEGQKIPSRSNSKAKETMSQDRELANATGARFAGVASSVTNQDDQTSGAMKHEKQNTTISREVSVNNNLQSSMDTITGDVPNTFASVSNAAQLEQSGQESVTHMIFREQNNDGVKRRVSEGLESSKKSKKPVPRSISAHPTQNSGIEVFIPHQIPITENSSENSTSVDQMFEDVAKSLVSVDTPIRRIESKATRPNSMPHEIRTKDGSKIKLHKFRLPDPALNATTMEDVVREMVPVIVGSSKTNSNSTEITSSKEKYKPRNDQKKRETAPPAISRVVSEVGEPSTMRIPVDTPKEHHKSQDQPKDLKTDDASMPHIAQNDRNRNSQSLPHKLDEKPVNRNRLSMKNLLKRPSLDINSESSPMLDYLPEENEIIKMWSVPLISSQFMEPINKPLPEVPIKRSRTVRPKLPDENYDSTIVLEEKWDNSLEEFLRKPDDNHAEKPKTSKRMSIKNLEMPDKPGESVWNFTKSVLALDSPGSVYADKMFKSNLKDEEEGHDSYEDGDEISEYDFYSDSENGDYSIFVDDYEFYSRSNSQIFDSGMNELFSYPAGSLAAPKVTRGSVPSKVVPERSVEKLEQSIRELFKMASFYEESEKNQSRVVDIDTSFAQGLNEKESKAATSSDESTSKGILDTKGVSQKPTLVIDTISKNPRNSIAHSGTSPLRNIVFSDDMENQDLPSPLRNTKQSFSRRSRKLLDQGSSVSADAEAAVAKGPITSYSNLPFQSIAFAPPLFGDDAIPDSRLKQLKDTYTTNEQDFQPMILKRKVSHAPLGSKRKGLNMRERDDSRPSDSFFPEGGQPLAKKAAVMTDAFEKDLLGASHKRKKSMKGRLRKPPAVALRKPTMYDMIKAKSIGDVTYLAAVKDPTVQDQLRGLKPHEPRFTYFIILLNFVVLIVQFIHSFNTSGMFYQTEPLNIMVGPPKEVLIRQGARYTPCIRSTGYEFLPYNCSVFREQSKEFVNLTQVKVDFERGDGDKYKDTSEVAIFAKRDFIPRARLIQEINSVNITTIYVDETVMEPTPTSVSTVRRPRRTQTATPTPTSTNIGDPAGVAIPKGFCTLQQFCGLQGFEKGFVPDQFFRFFTASFIHAGVLQCFANSWAWYYVGGPMESAYGWFRIACIYLISGFSGYVVGGLSSLNIPAMGSSAAVLGVHACVLLDLILNFRLVPDRWNELSKVIAGTLVAFAIGTLPYFDNFAHFGGLVAGLLTGAALFPSISFSEQDRNIKRTIKIISGPLLIFILTIMILSFYNTNPFFECKWCKFFDCIPILDWCSGYPQ
ncbi:hypothetical protein MP638_002344 [Amoeboaphelidium occidentale]|nr:hypothetical protein MP638_002344 [Amoeboaphelidium occidentale]